MRICCIAYVGCYSFGVGKYLSIGVNDWYWYGQLKAVGKCGGYPEANEKVSPNDANNSWTELRWFWKSCFLFIAGDGCLNLKMPDFKPRNHAVSAFIDFYFQFVRSPHLLQKVIKDFIKQFKIFWCDNFFLTLVLIIARHCCNVECRVK